MAKDYGSFRDTQVTHEAIGRLHRAHAGKADRAIGRFAGQGHTLSAFALRWDSYELHVQARMNRGVETARLIELITRPLRACASRLARAARRRRDARLLSGMDDRALHDIGLVRSDIERAVRLGRE